VDSSNFYCNPRCDNRLLRYRRDSATQWQKRGESSGRASEQVIAVCHDLAVLPLHDKPGIRVPIPSTYIDGGDKQDAHRGV
jgi:hypothetical protein